MKIVVTEYKRTSSFTRFYTAENHLAKEVLKALQKDYFDNTDLYILEKLGFTIIEKK